MLICIVSDGTFDHKGYTEKALHRMIKAKAKADKAARNIISIDLPPLPITAASTSTSRAPTPVEGATPRDDDAASVGPQAAEGSAAPALPAKDVVVDRATLLKSNKDVVHPFIRLLVPILVDVYAASVSPSVRVKCLTGLLKAICFLDGNNLVKMLKVHFHITLRVTFLTGFGFAACTDGQLC